MTHIHNAIQRSQTVTFGGACSPLSMWHESPFQVRGLYFSSIGQYLAWKKAQFTGGASIAEAIYDAETQEDAIAAKSRLTAVDSEKWMAIAPSVVTEALVCQLGQYPAAREFLLSTEDKLLVEVNPYDTFWASGLDAYDPRLTSLEPEDWPGQNAWGKILMTMRATIKECLPVAQPAAVA